jgi:hypothetical protein
VTTGATLCEIALCLAFCSLAAFWRRQLHSRSPRLGQTNGDRLLWRSGAMFAFPDVFHFFAHKLACLSGRRLAFALIFARAFNYFFFWHNKRISPLKRCLAVNNKEAGVTSRRFVVSKEPVLSSAWLTATLLTATLFFALAPVTFTFFSLAIVLSALLSGAGRWKAIWTETPIGLMDGCLIRQNPTGHAIT